MGRLLRPVDPRLATEPDVFAGRFDLEAVYDFSRAGIEQSIAESLERPGLDRIDNGAVWHPVLEAIEAVGSTR